MGTDLKNVLINHTSKTSLKGKTDSVDKSNTKTDSKELSEFQKILQGKETPGINVSKHAIKRIQERNMSLDGTEFVKIREAMDKLKSKGGKDSLIITDNGAYIVDVAKNTIVTAMDKNQLQDNIFTKIDSTLIIN